MADQQSTAPIAKISSWQRGHHQNPDNHPEDLLFRTIKDAGWHAFGIISIELWATDSDGLKVSRPESGHWMDPLFIHTCLNPELARKVNENALDCAPGESLAGLLFTRTSKSWKYEQSKVYWRLINSMFDDPFIEQGPDKRMKKLHDIGIGFVATVPFRFQRRSGIVIFMSRTTVDTVLLQSKKNEEFILGATDLIGATYAIQEARKDISIDKSARLRSAVEKVKASIKVKKHSESGKSIFAMSVLAAMAASRTSNDQQPLVEEGTIDQLVSLSLLSEDEKGKSFVESPNLNTKEEKLGQLRALASDLIQHLRKSVLKWQGAGLRAPPRQDCQESFIAFIGIFITMLALDRVDVSLKDLLHNFEPGWYAGTLCIVYSLTSAPVGQPSQIVLAHLWCSLVGLAFERIPIPKFVKISLSTAFGVSGMASLGIMHPPATSFAYVFAQKKSYTIYSILMILLGGELCVLSASINVQIYHQAFLCLPGRSVCDCNLDYLPESFQP